jgi:dCMP deaminase
MEQLNNNPVIREPVDWDTLFLNIAFDVAERSKDPSTQAGAVLVEAGTKRIISTGFNGPPPDLDDTKVPWNKRPEKYAYIIHSEENALLYGLDAVGANRISYAKIYCTHHPCTECLLRLIRSNVREIVIPECHATYPLSKFQVNPDDLLAKIKKSYRKPIITKVPYVKRYNGSNLTGNSERKDA